MASENTENNAEDIARQSEPNEHDYAHSAAPNLPGVDASSLGVPAQESSITPAEPVQNAPAQPPVSEEVTVELPEPAVGAEVDCPGGLDVEAADDAAKPAAAAASRGPRRLKRPEDKNCCCCKCEFERQGRSFNRRAVFTFTSPDTVRWAFPDAAVQEKSFMCETCAQVIRSRCKRKQSGKRTLWLKPPVTKTSDARDKKKKGRRMGKKGKAALLVSKSCYKAAFKMLWSAKGARKPMMDFWSKQLKEEMKALSRQADSPFHQKVSNKKPLSSFPWGRCLNWAEEKAPLVTACLRSLFPDVNALAKSSHQLSEEQAQTLLERRTVVTLSVPLFTRNIWKNNFLQAALGAELRLQGCSGSSLDALNTMGLCQNKDTVRLLLHRLRSNKKASTQNGRQRMKMKRELKGGQVTDMEEEEDDEEEEEEEEEIIEMAVEEEEEEVEQEEVQDGVQEQEEEDDDDDDDDDDDNDNNQAVEEKAEMEKMRRKKSKKQRKEKRKERGKRKAKEREEEEQDDDDEGLEQKKRRVVVVRLGLLKGHSEVGRSDLSAP